MSKEISLAHTGSEYLRQYLPQGAVPLNKLKYIDIIINESSYYNYFHLFKNTYIRGVLTNEESYLVEACSPLGVKHIMKALSLAQEYKLGNPQISTPKIPADIYNYHFSALHKDLKALQKMVDCSDIVLFGRSESIRDWFGKKKLRELEVDQEVINEIYTKKELGRINVHQESINILEEKINEKTLRELYRQLPQESISIGRVSGFGFQYNGRQIAVIDRPWGRDMAYTFSKEICHTSSPNSIGIIGGCGSIIDAYPIETVMIPYSVSSPEYPQTDLNNLLEAEQKVHVFNVDSPFDETKEQLHKIQNAGIHAVEMELMGFARGIQENTDLYCALYVMDQPAKGITLNETYYNQEFLKQLFQKNRRAKDEAIEKVIGGIINA